MIVGDGRPLRFLALIAAGWTGARVLILWNATGSLPDAIRDVVVKPVQAAVVLPTVSKVPGMSVVSHRPVPRAHRRRSQRTDAALFTAPDLATVGMVLPEVAAVEPSVPGMTGVAASSVALAVAWPTDPAFQVPPPTLPHTPATVRSLSVSAWMIARGGTGIGASALAPQLGGTQGGVRVDYALRAGFAATGRVAAPAAGAGREVSLGVAWRPAGVPVRVVAEHRFALDRGRGGPAIGISTGVSELALPANFRLDGYGQAGAILRDGVERYVDASLRAARPVARLRGVAVDIGGGAWGGAQRGVARVDVGPSVGARIPLAGRALRASIDWRHRIIGNARPGSGLALTLGTDF